MNKEEFIGKLQMVYFGDRNAFNEIVEDNQKLKNELVYSKVEIDRLNNIINELDKDIYSLYEDICNSNDTYSYRMYHDEIIDRLDKISDKLQELKEE